MNKIIIAIGLMWTTLVFSRNLPKPEHLPLDLSLSEYQILWKNFKLQHGENARKGMEPETEAAIQGGEKLSQWISKINESRNPDDQIRLSNPGTRRGIPIEAPSIYGPIQIKEDYDGFQVSLPDAIKTVVYGDAPISSTLPTDRETFITWGRKINRLYQTAVRWHTSIKPWLSYYKANKARDVRGLYFLKQVENLDEKLVDYLNLNRDEKEKLRRWMENLCLNNRRSPETCTRHFRNLMNSGELVKYKETYWNVAQENWDLFFKITRPRTDVEWKGTSENTMKVVFLDPNSDRIKDWLQENIEDEFKTESWNLEMTFVSRNRQGLSHIEFKPNTTPHVREGNVIVMDANSPIEEDIVKWTIRHEYGHILRIPDCYVEFYDEEIESVVNYQLDVTDLMCSRAGNFNTRIYDELKRVYFKPDQK